MTDVIEKLTNIGVLAVLGGIAYLGYLWYTEKEDPWSFTWPKWVIDIPPLYPTDPEIDSILDAAEDPVLDLSPGLTSGLFTGSGVP